jgi:hypothetical protein
MKAYILFTIAALLVVSGSAQKSFEADITVFKNETAKLDRLEIIESRADKYQGSEGSFTLEAIDSDGKVVWSQSRRINFYLLTNPPTKIDSKTQRYSIPFEKEITGLSLKKDGENIFSANITDRICKYDNKCPSYCSGKSVDVDCSCGNEICENHETKELCFEDCGDDEPSSPGAGDFGSSDADNDDNSDSEDNDDDTGSSYSVLAYAFVGLLLLTLGYILLRTDL